MNRPNEQDSASLPDVLRNHRRLDAEESFCFECHSQLECFTNCCSDVNILLTPVDVLKLSRRLKLTTGEFLDQYTLTPITKDLHLPVVILRMSDTPEKKCQLLSEAGCTVYEDRPWSCRMYPVGSALPPARAGVQPKPVYFLFEDDYCKGGGEKRQWTVEQWRTDQGLDQRGDLEEGFQEIVSHPWFIGGRQLDPKRMHMFHMACYDLDAFREFVFGTTFTQRFDLENGLVEKLRSDDEALLRFAYRWLRFALFAEPTMKVREGAEPAASKQ